MDLFRMIFCVFFKDFQRGILFRAIFFYTLSLLSSEFSSGLLSSAFFPTHLSSGSRFIRPLLSLASYFLLPLLPFSPSLLATSAPLFSRLPRFPSLLPAPSLLFASHPSDSHPSGSHPFGLLPSGSLSPPPLGGFFIFLLPRLRIQPRPFARPCPPVPLWDHSADRDLSLHVAVSRCRSWTRFRP